MKTRTPKPRGLGLTLVNPLADYIPGMMSAAVNYKVPPLGPAHMASYIRLRFPDARVNIIDSHSLGLGHEATIKAVEQTRPDLVGFTVYTPSVPLIKELLAATRARLPGVQTMVGGPHVCVMPGEFAGLADYIFIGESEKTLAYLVGTLTGAEPGATPRIRSESGSTIFESGLEPDLDSLPFPAYDLLPNHLYSHIFPYRRKGAFSAILTSRGCPYDCNFCANKRIWGKRIRRRSVDNVFAEIKLLYHKYNVRLLLINDDHFLADYDRVEEFCRRFEHEKLDLRWIARSRADIDRERILPMLKAAGCVELQAGVESGSQQVLDSMNKRLDLGETIEFFKAARRAGINTWATFIVGDPLESRETFAETLRFMKQIDPTYATFLFLLPFPGTRIFEQMEAQGRILTRDWREYNWHKAPIFEHPRLSRAEIVQMRKTAYRSFYLRPRILLRYLRAMISSGNFADTMRSGLIALKFIFNR